MAELPDVTGPADPRQLRTSAAERERVADVLRQAAVDGRLGLDELDERLAKVYASRTFAELEPLTGDLPATVSGPAARSAPVHGTGPTSSGAVAIMGGFSRRGRWLAPRRFTCLAFWGGGEVDLREAQLADIEVTVRAFAVMGGISVVVPEDAEVHVGGVGIMGAFDNRASGPGGPGGIRVNVTGLAFWGGIDVVRRPPDEELKRRKLERKRQKAERRQIDN